VSPLPDSTATPAELLKRDGVPWLELLPPTVLRDAEFVMITPVHFVGQRQLAEVGPDEIAEYEISVAVEPRSGPPNDWPRSVLARAAGASRLVLRPRSRSARPAARWAARACRLVGPDQVAPIKLPVRTGPWILTRRYFPR